MILFNVKEFGNDKKVFQLQGDEIHCIELLNIPQSDELYPINGFVSEAKRDADYVVALKKKTLNAITFPDWEGETLICLQQKKFSPSDVESSNFLDWIFLRRLVVNFKNGDQYVHWYRPKFRDWLWPSDPMMPWGTDFYRFLYDQVLSR